MSYDPTIGTWIEADPAQYIDGPNRYRMERSNPTTLLDPSGLDPTYPTLPLRPPSDRYIKPTGQVALPGPHEDAPTDEDSPGADFYQNFIRSASWSGSTPDGHGGVSSHFLQLTLPQNWDTCDQTVQDLVNKFNDRAQQHEQAYARWLQQQIDAGLTPAQINAARNGLVGPDAGWELSEQLEMYQLLLAAHNATLPNGGHDALSDLLKNKIKNTAKKLTDTNSLQTCPAEKPYIE